MYTDKNVSLIDDDVDPDSLVEPRLWFIQLVVWMIITSLSNLIKFFVQVGFPVTLVEMADFFLNPLKGHQQLEIVVVMMFAPLLLNSIILWI